jgi:hypothetical protein
MPHESTGCGGSYEPPVPELVLALSVVAPFDAISSAQPARQSPRPSAMLRAIPPALIRGAGPQNGQLASLARTHRPQDSQAHIIQTSSQEQSTSMRRFAPPGQAASERPASRVGSGSAGVLGLEGRELVRRW